MFKFGSPLTPSPSHTGQVDTVKTVFEWGIENVRLVKKNVGEVLSSPEFLVNNTKWQFKIYPNGCTQDCEGYVSVALQSLSPEKSKEYILAVSFVNYCNKLLFSCMECVTFTTEHSLWRCEKLTKYEEFLGKINHVSPDNKLKIKCELIPKTSNFSNVFTPLNFEGFFNSEKHSDVKFLITGKILYAHKVILSNRSQVFAAMFEHPMKENLENSVKVEDIEYEVFVEMLRYVYTGRVTNMKNNVKNLLITADKYAIDDLKFICSECLCGSLSKDNVVEYLQLADMYDVKALRSRAIDFILSNAKTLMDMPSFKSIVDLRRDLVFEIIQRLVQDKNKIDEPVTSINTPSSTSSSTMFSYTLAQNASPFAFAGTDNTGSANTVPRTLSIFDKNGFLNY